MSNYTDFVESLSPASQTILGGVIFFSMFGIFSLVLLSDMHYYIRRIERVLKDDDRYID